MDAAEEVRKELAAAGSMLGLGLFMTVDGVRRICEKGWSRARVAEAAIGAIMTTVSAVWSNSCFDAIAAARVMELHPIAKWAQEAPEELASRVALALRNARNGDIHT